MPARLSKSRRRSKRRTRRSRRRHSKRRTRRSKRRNEYTAADMGDFTESLLGQLPNPVYNTQTNIGNLSPTFADEGLRTNPNSSFSSDEEALVLDSGMSQQRNYGIRTEMAQPAQPQQSRVSSVNNTRARPLSRQRSRSRSRMRENKHGHYSGARCKVRTLQEGASLPWGGKVKKNNGHIKTVPNDELIYPYPIYARPHGKKGEDRDLAYFRRGLRDVVYYTKYQISKFCNAKRSGRCSELKYTYRRNSAQREGRRPVRTKRITKGCEYYTPTERGSISGPNRQSYSDRKYHKRSRSRSRRRRRSRT